MKNNSQKGFSLIELLMVMVIIGILAIMTAPFLRKAKDSAEEGNVQGSLKTMLVTQTNFFTENSRYARMDELNNFQSGSLGTMEGNNLRRGSYIFAMSPNETPADDSLREGFKILATKPGFAGEPPTVIELTNRGIKRIY